jgi:hypothetical protein
MAQASTVYSQGILNADGGTVVGNVATLHVNPSLANTAAEGAVGNMLTVSDVVTIASGDNTSSTYSFVRIPTSAHVKRVVLYSTGVATSGAADFNVRFSDSQTDGTPSSLQGTVPQINGSNNKLFGAAQPLLAVNGLDLTYANIANYPYGSENQPLWAVLGFTADPGGFFDIVAYVTTNVTTGGSALLKVDYAVPGAS